MKKLKPLLAAIIVAAVLATPAMARRSQATSLSPTANAYARATTVYGRDRAGDSRSFAERDPWGHWGGYYAPWFTFLKPNFSLKARKTSAGRAWMQALNLIQGRAEQSSSAQYRPEKE